ncbi:DNA-binding protein RFX8-like [Polyodon spathula]|uniref:DNA-binding protein RFX8-like n=1 Tax=Polyodon spathula TaxID=7913 RepID=UPI001B7F0701|nr:DNA-binding protein RFX8-like [Polyodon spathula]
MYDFYLEACSLLEQNQVNPATFGKAQTHSYPCELVRNHFWEKQLEQKYFHRFTFIADEYYNYCQDILQNVQDLVIFFWKSLPVSVIELMSLPDVSQLFSSYDAHLYKMIEGILINDFLEDISVQDLKRARMFSKNFRSWLLTVLDDFPVMLQASKRKGFHAVYSWLSTSADIKTYLDGVVTLLQAFIFQPRRSNGVFSGLAADFLLRWNYFLTDISRAMILLNAESFGSWHLLNLLLSDYVLHILHSYMEEKTEWLAEEPLKELPPLVAPLESELAVGVVDPPQNLAVEQSYQSAEPANSNALTLEGITVHVVGFLVDSATGNKLIQIMLEDKSANCAVKVDLPVGQEAMVTLRDGQKFMIHTCDIGAAPSAHQSPEESRMGAFFAPPPVAGPSQPRLLTPSQSPSSGIPCAQTSLSIRIQYQQVRDIIDMKAKISLIMELLERQQAPMALAAASHVAPPSPPVPLRVAVPPPISLWENKVSRKTGHYDRTRTRSPSQLFGGSLLFQRRWRRSRACIPNQSSPYFRGVLG